MRFTKNFSSVPPLMPVSASGQVFSQLVGSAVEDAAQPVLAPRAACETDVARFSFGATAVMAGMVATGGRATAASSRVSCPYPLAGSYLAARP